jgi:hypothetical protein
MDSELAVMWTNTACSLDEMRIIAKILEVSSVRHLVYMKVILVTKEITIILICST